MITSATPSVATVAPDVKNASVSIGNLPVQPTPHMTTTAAAIGPEARSGLGSELAPRFSLVPPGSLRPSSSTATTPIPTPTHGITLDHPHFLQHPSNPLSTPANITLCCTGDWTGALEASNLDDEYNDGGASPWTYPSSQRPGSGVSSGAAVSPSVKGGGLIRLKPPPVPSSSSQTHGQGLGQIQETTRLSQELTRVTALLQQAEDAARTHFASAQTAIEENTRIEAAAQKARSEAHVRKMQLQEQVVELEGQLETARGGLERVQIDRDRLLTLYRDCEDRTVLLEEQVQRDQETIATLENRLQKVTKKYTDARAQADRDRQALLAAQEDLARLHSSGRGGFGDMEGDVMMSMGNDDDDDDDDDYEEENLHNSILARSIRSAHKSTPQTTATGGKSDPSVRRALDSQIDNLTQQLSAAGAYMSQLSGRLTDLEGQGQGLGQGQGQGLGFGLSSPTPSKQTGPMPGTNPFQLAASLQTPNNINSNNNNSNNSNAAYGNESFLQGSIMRTGTGSDTGMGTGMGLPTGPHHQLGLDVVEMNRDLYFEKSKAEMAVKECEMQIERQKIELVSLREELERATGSVGELQASMVALLRR